jgi:hypothetical protein
MKKHKKTPDEKAAVLKMKRKQRRAKRQAMNKQAVENNIGQDDTFFNIAGLYFLWCTIWSNLGRNGTETMAGIRRGVMKCT